MKKDRKGKKERKRRRGMKKKPKEREGNYGNLVGVEELSRASEFREPARVKHSNLLEETIRRENVYQSTLMTLATRMYRRFRELRGRACACVGM